MNFEGAYADKSRTFTFFITLQVLHLFKEMQQSLKNAKDRLMQVK